MIKWGSFRKRFIFEFFEMELIVQMIKVRRELIDIVPRPLNQIGVLGILVELGLGVSRTSLCAESFALDQSQKKIPETITFDRVQGNDGFDFLAFGVVGDSSGGVG